MKQLSAFVLIKPGDAKLKGKLVQVVKLAAVANLMRHEVRNYAQHDHDLADCSADRSTRQTAAQDW